jgi:hypothetical protein
LKNEQDGVHTHAPNGLRGTGSLLCYFRNRSVYGKSSPYICIQCLSGSKTADLRHFSWITAVQEHTGDQQAQAQAQKLIGTRAAGLAGKIVPRWAHTCRMRLTLVGIAHSSRSTTCIILCNICSLENAILSVNTTCRFTQ